MDAAAIISRIQVLRLGILPPYTYDDDEGGRSDEEYFAFYGQSIDRCLESVEQHIESSRSLLAARQSKGTFHRYLTTRARFIETLPFCFDELADEESAAKAGMIESLWLSMSNEQRPMLKEAELGALTEYRKLLMSLREWTGGAAGLRHG